MRKLILISVIAMSVLVARDCRYEEQELNMLIQQYEDLQDEAEYEARQRNVEMHRQNIQDLYDKKDPYETMLRNYHNATDSKAKYNYRFNRLNQRIEQQKQRLNNCRNGK